MRKRVHIALAALVIPFFVFARDMPGNNPEPAKKNPGYFAEPGIYSGGFATAEVLRKGGWVFSPNGFYIYGLTPRFTYMIDYLATIFGIPAGFVRYQFYRGENLRMAVELYTCIFSFDLDDQWVSIKEFKVSHRGQHNTRRMLLKYRLSEKSSLHFYSGTTFDSYTKYSSRNALFPDKEYINTISQDTGIGYAYIVSHRFRMLLNYSSGNMLMFYDQAPQKSSLNYSLNFAPFPRNWPGFFSAMRFELHFLQTNIPDAHFSNFQILPQFFWQW